MTDDDEQLEAETLVMEAEILAMFAAMTVDEQTRRIAEIIRWTVRFAFDTGCWRETADTWDEYIAQKAAEYAPGFEDSVILIGRQVAAGAN